MEELELKHLAPYLPYGLKFFWKDEIISDTPKVMAARSIEYWETIKPILRPLADISERIEFNGDEIIPLMYLDKDEKGGHQFYSEFKNLPRMEYDVVETLFQLHFDVFGLIPQGLAIDINTLKK